jgi:hypothetical protein
LSGHSVKQPSQIAIKTRNIWPGERAETIRRANAKEDDEPAN